MNSDLVIVAMSGGVDSSVCAALLKEQGHNLIGITMRVWDDPDGRQASPGSCCSLDDADDARRVAQQLEIPHYTLNVKEEFKRKVVDNFVGEYLRGRTPNPCVLCNQEIKFDYLFEQGRKFGATRIATGHYASIGSFKGHAVVKRGRDLSKDQSYFLFSIDPSRLANVMFPLGGYSKTEARAMARKYNLNVAEKAESQEICFIPDDDYKSFIVARPGAKAIGTGDIVNGAGEVLGRHAGYTGYTVGQRKGLGISAPRPLYVTGIEPESNRVIVGEKSELYAGSLLAIDVNWYTPPGKLEGVELTARIRHGAPDVPAVVTVTGERRVKVEFAKPQLSVSPGQAVVFYHDDFVVGGGWIDKALG